MLFGPLSYLYTQRLASLKIPLWVQDMKSTTSMYYFRKLKKTITGVFDHTSKELQREGQDPLNN